MVRVPIGTVNYGKIAALTARSPHSIRIHVCFLCNTYHKLRMCIYTWTLTNRCTHALINYSYVHIFITRA